jgi:dihydrofolate synthase/folylpolyglutamate synthase
VRPDWVERGESPPIAARNRSLAALALDELGRRGVLARDGRPLGGHLLDDDAVRAARLPGRCERFSVGGIPVVLDGAHTPESVALALRDLERDLGPRPIAILGLARDKDLDGVLKALAHRVERLVCTSVGSALHRTAEEIGGAAAAAGMAAETAATPRTALERAVQASGGRGWILATGSLYLAGALRPVLNRAPPTC